MTATESAQRRENYVGRYSAVFRGVLFESEAAEAKIVICFTLPLPHFRDRLHTVPSPPRHNPLRPRRLKLGTYNIRDGQGFGLAQAIRAVQLGNFGVLILT